MWALPSIEKMNLLASTGRAKLEAAAETLRDPGTGKPAACEHYGSRTRKCGEELRSYLWYDIFSDDPKGVLFLCDEHDGYSGSPTEGFFECEACQRVMAENYTWERYVHDEEDVRLCLNCWAKDVIASLGEKHQHPAWIDLTDEGIAALDFDRVRSAPHIIAVSGPTHGLEFHGNVEVDSSTGGRLGGFTSCEASPDGAVAELREKLREVREKGYKQALLVLDGAYQFSVSLGVYTKGAPHANKD